MRAMRKKIPAWFQISGGWKPSIFSDGPLMSANTKASTVETTNMVPMILINPSNVWYFPRIKIPVHIPNKITIVHIPKKSICKRFSRKPVVTNPTAAVTKNIDAIVIKK